MDEVIPLKLQPCFFLSLHRRSRCLQDGRVTANLDLTRPGGSTAGPLRRLCASHGQAAAAAGVFRTASPPPVFPRCAAAVSLPAASRSGAAPPAVGLRHHRASARGPDDRRCRHLAGGRSGPPWEGRRAGGLGFAAAAHAGMLRRRGSEPPKAASGPLSLPCVLALCTAEGAHWRRWMLCEASQVVYSVTITKNNNFSFL
jgi:hypothetical protein